MEVSWRSVGGGKLEVVSVVLSKDSVHPVGLEPTPTIDYDLNVAP